jgi:hypothetical protein
MGKHRVFVAAVSALAILPAGVWADSYVNTFVGATQTNWSRVENWSQGVAPVARGGTSTDGSQIAQVSVTRPTTVTFDAVYPPAATLLSLNLTASGGAALTFSQPQGMLGANSTTLDSAADSSVTYLNSGGRHSAPSPAGVITLAASVGSTAAYRLSNDGVVRTAELVVGKSGDATFYQSSGAVSVYETMTLAAGASATARYTLGTGSLTAANEVIGGGGTALLRQLGGTHVVDSSLTIGTGGTYEISGGSLHAAALSYDGTFALSAGATVVDSLTSPSRLLLSDTASLTVKSGRLDSLSLAGHATLNVAPGGEVTLGGVSEEALRSYLLTHNIVSCDSSFTLGYLPVDGGFLVKPAVAGDANLDGVIDADDYAAIEAGAGMARPSWCTGDFNFDGRVTDEDYSLIAQAAASVPEPAGVMVGTLALLAGRRRKR